MQVAVYENFCKFPFTPADGRNKNFASGRLHKILQVCVYNIFGRFLPENYIGRKHAYIPAFARIFCLGSGGVVAPPRGPRGTDPSPAEPPPERLERLREEERPQGPRIRHAQEQESRRQGKNPGGGLII